MQEANQKQPSKSGEALSTARMVALGLIVVGGLTTALEGKSGNIFGWLGFGMLLVGLIMFVGLLITGAVARLKKRQ